MYDDLVGAVLLKRLITSRTFFEDTHAKPMPEMLVPADLAGITAFFRAEAPRSFGTLPEKPGR